MLNRLSLKKKVTIEGTNFWGRPSRISFEPTSRLGWWWRTGGNEIGITAKIMDCRKRRLALADPYDLERSDRLEVVEHIAALMATGLDGIVIESDEWPPYEGCAGQYLDALLPHLTESDHEPLRFVHPFGNETVRVSRNRDRFVQLHGGDANPSRLVIRVRVSFKGVGEHVERFTLDGSASSMEHLYQILRTNTFGWPRYAKYALVLTNAFYRGPRMRDIVWSQDMEPEQALRSAALHRIQDILGVVMTARFRSGEVVSGTYESNMGGHLLDLNLVRQIA